MKKYIIILFLLTTIHLHAEPGVGTSLDLSYLGYYDQDRIFSTDVSIWYNIEMYGIRLTPYGGVKTWFINNGCLVYGGNPFRDSYYIGSEVSFAGFTLGFDHYCEHPVYGNQKHYSKYNLREVLVYIPGQRYPKKEIWTEFSQLSKTTLSYTLRLGDFRLLAGGSQSPDAYLLNGEASYDLNIWKFTIQPHGDIQGWYVDRKLTRWVYNAGLSIGIGGFKLSADYYKSSRARYIQEDEHLYGEFPLYPKDISFSLSYSYRGCE